MRLIPAQHVKALVRRQKNDANDALAICETAFRLGIHFVSVKTTEQQDIKALRNTRQLIVDATQFSSGRELSAWCGLLPRQHSSGGKQRLSAVTKNGSRSLRTLIIHGVRAVMRCVKKRDDNLGRWLQKLEARRGFLKTTVALASKLTLIIWRVLTDSVDFNMNRTFSMV